MGHFYDGIFQFYINQHIKCDVQAVYLDKLSNRALIKVMGNISLIFNPHAPKGLTKKQLYKVVNYPKIIKLYQQKDNLTKKIK